MTKETPRYETRWKKIAKKVKTRWKKIAFEERKSYATVL